MGVTYLGDAISGIYNSLSDQGIARMQREFKPVEGEMVPTGNVRWQICDVNALKAALVGSIGKDKAIALGARLQGTEEPLKLHRLIELMSPEELTAMEQYLLGEAVGGEA